MFRHGTKIEKESYIIQQQLINNSAGVIENDVNIVNEVEEKATENVVENTLPVNNEVTMVEETDESEDGDKEKKAVIKEDDNEEDTDVMPDPDDAKPSDE